MLGEGFDEPRCLAVWIAVESESDIRYVQMAGRALRQLPGKVAKLFCESGTIRRRLSRALARCHTPWWRTLGLDAPPADLGEVDVAYRRKALAVHPDRGGSEDAMKRLNAARATARDALKTR
jgi:hypothetical protein